MNTKFYGNHGVCASAVTVCVVVLAIVASQNGAVNAQEPCITPTLAKGVCIPFKKCSYVTQQITMYGSNLPRVFRNFLYKSSCNGTEPGFHVCCDTSYLDTPKTSSLPKPGETVPSSGPSATQSPTQLNTNTVAPTVNIKGKEILLGTPCGNTSDDRVAFGEATGLAEYPWMARLKFDTPAEDYKCGGSLITNRYVLTAAHCVVGNRDSVIGVRLGEHDTEAEPDCEKRGKKTVCAPKVEDYGIEKSIPHPEYDRVHMLNDVALIKLDRVVSFDWHISPICLPVTEHSAKLQDNQDFIIAGWGTTENGSTSTVLLKAVVPNQERKVCQDVYKRAHITENHLCVGGNGRIDSCKGDSGGPLFFKVRYQRVPRYVQYGIVSFGGDICGDVNTFPGIYANVMDLLPWITNNID